MTVNLDPTSMVTPCGAIIFRPLASILSATDQRILCPPEEVQDMRVSSEEKSIPKSERFLAIYRGIDRADFATTELLSWLYEIREPDFAPGSKSDAVGFSK